MSPITAAHEQQRKQLLSSEDHENAVVYIKERRTACSVFTSWFGSFAMGVIAASAVFVLLSMRGHLVIKPTYSFAKNNALPDGQYLCASSERWGSVLLIRNSAPRNHHLQGRPGLLCARVR